MRVPSHVTRARRVLVAGVASAAVALAVSALPLATSAAVTEGEATVRVTVTNNGVRELPPESETVLRVFTHEERPSHRRKQPVSLCQVTSNDGATTYALTGWRLPAGAFPFTVNAEEAPAGIKGTVPGALAAAAATWTGADPDKQLTYAGSTAVSRPRYDGTNAILWRRLSRRTVAAAYVWYHPGTGEVLDADMVFNTRVPWTVSDPASGDCGGDPNAYDVRAIAVHEFGHFLGLDDLYDPGTVDLTMHGITTVGELKKATLGAGDTLGAQAVAP